MRAQCRGKVQPRSCFVPETMTSLSEESRKRKALEQNGARSGKRQRVAEPVPIVLDEFETEAKREVDANAGLTGAQVTAGQKISLSHQV